MADEGRSRGTEPSGRTRVLFVLNQMGMGGSERQLFELTHALEHGGTYEPHVVFFGRDDEFLRVHGFGEIPVARVPRYRRAWWPPDWFDFRDRLADHIRAVAPELVVTWNASAGFWGAWSAVRARVPRIVLSERTVFYRVRRKDRIRSRFILPHVDGVITNSHAGVDWITAVKGVPRERIHVLENGVDLSRFSDIDAHAVRSWRRRFLADGDGLLIGVVARLAHEKNHHLLLESLSRIAPRLPTPWHLVLIGDGDLRADLRAEVDALSLGGHVTFVGTVAPSDVPVALSGCDFTVLPSDQEGFPNAVLESLAAGTPVIATDVSDNHRLIQPGETGLLVPRGDAGRLAGALTDAAHSWTGRVRVAMADAARDVAGEYGRDGLVLRAEALLDRILARPRRLAATSPADVDSGRAAS